jgi:ABC-type branched-subunit amino acid transport system substrate-binding protein
MSHICLLDLTSETALECLSARLRIATIDDRTGAIINPHYAGNGTLKIAPLINLNRQIIDKFQIAACERKYLGGIKIPDTMIDRVADRIDELRTDVREFQQLLDRTFTQDSWSRIREELLQSLIGIAPTEPIRLAIITDDYELQSLPIENTTFITDVLGKNNRSVSVVFSPREQQKKLFWKDVPKILLVLGSQRGIEEPIDINEIKKYFPAPAIFELLSHPSREQLLRTISDRVFDIIIIIGHSHADRCGSDGKININDELNENLDGISIQQFTQPFKNSVNKGLKLVILAGCSSIGVARALVSQQIGVPNVIAFRIPVHYRVLRLFFDRLLNYWIVRAESLEVALTQTRGELKLYDRDAPGASILPILLTSPWDIPLHFPKRMRSRWQKRILHIAIVHTLLTSKAKWDKVKKISILGMGLAGAIACWYIAQLPKLADACNFVQGDRINCYEEILLTPRNTPSRDDKRAGADAIANKDYAQAAQLLTKSWNAKQDPETLIMLENAKLKLQSLPIKSIAVSIPASGPTPLEIPTGMLKAVAFAQQQWNADPKHTWKLQVAIVDDGNDKYSAPKLIDNLLDRDILAGIGSYSSEVTSEIKNNYTKHGTVLVSSTSTATELTNRNPHNFFFRVCASNKISGNAIANYLKTHKYNKIALFHTSGKKFSDSMTKALKENLQGISIVEESNFEPTGNAIEVINRVKQAGAQAIVLIPDAYTDQAPARDRLLSLIEANNGDLPIVGNEIVKDQTLFTRFNERQLQKLVISLPWHSSTYRNNTIVEPAFWGNKAQLDHRIAMTYDATQVVIQALDRVPNNLPPIEARAEIQKIISSNTFNTQGITGEVSFTGSDRYQSINSLVQPICIQGKCAGFQPAP